MRTYLLLLLSTASVSLTGCLMYNPLRPHMTIFRMDTPGNGLLCYYDRSGDLITTSSVPGEYRLQRVKGRDCRVDTPSETFRLPIMKDAAGQAISVAESVAHPGYCLPIHRGDELRENTLLPCAEHIGFLRGQDPL